LIIALARSRTHKIQLAQPETFCAHFKNGIHCETRYRHGNTYQHTNAGNQLMVLNKPTSSATANGQRRTTLRNGLRNVFCLTHSYDSIWRFAGQIDEKTRRDMGERDRLQTENKKARRFPAGPSNYFSDALR